MNILIVNLLSEAEMNSTNHESASIDLVVLEL